METEIIEAIKSHNLIEIYYEDQLQIIEPHCYGLTSSGDEIIIGYQIATNYEYKELGWKQYLLDEAHDLNILLQTFKNTRTNLIKDNKLAKIHVKI